MENTRRSFALSLGVSLLAVWVYFGFPPLSLAALSEGTFFNTLAKIIAIPLTLAIIAGGGLAAAAALGSVTDDEATREIERRKLALAAPAGVIWVLFVGLMAFPLGPVGNAIVIGAGGLAVLRIVQNALTLGILADAPSA